MAGDLLFVDVSGLVAGFEEFEAELKEKLAHAAELLSAQAHAHILEQASARLHTRLEQYTEHLEPPEQIASGLFAITLQPEARWIEDGLEAHNMLEDLLASPKAKTSKTTGQKYIIIPFKHSQGPKKLTPHGRQLKAAVLGELRKRKIPYNKVETHPDGTPKMGVLHSFDIANPDRQHRVRSGQEGPSGRPNAINTPGHGQAGPSGMPYLWGTKVIQGHKKNKHGEIELGKDGHPKVERSIFTFRVASASQAGTGKWDHPGTAAMLFFDDAERWARQELEHEVFPEILRGLGLQ